MTETKDTFDPTPLLNLLEGAVRRYPSGREASSLAAAREAWEGLAVGFSTSPPAGFADVLDGLCALAISVHSTGSDARTVEHQKRTLLDRLATVRAALAESIR